MSTHVRGGRPLLPLILLAATACERTLVPTADVQEGELPFTASFSVAETERVRSDATVTWDFGDGETATGWETEHTWFASGTYPVTATASWEGDELASGSLRVEVEPESCPEQGDAEVWGEVESSEAYETSGLVDSRANPGVLWVHNDSGDSARLFAMSHDGRDLGTWELQDVVAVDWEDLAIGEYPETGEPCLYVGDVGDNAEIRDSVVVYRVPEPEVSADLDEPEGGYLAVESFELDYPDDASYNSETLLVDPVTQDLYLVRKDYGGITGIYRKPAPHTDGERVTLEQVAELDFAEEPLSGGATTGGEVNLYGNHVAIRTYGTEAFLWLRDARYDFQAAFEADPCSYTVPMERQAETLAFTAEDDGLLSISEGDNPDINFIPLE